MEFVELTEKEFKKFYSNRDDENFMQSLELANLRKSEGKEVLFFGVKGNNKVRCATMLYEDIRFLNHKIFYAPRGFLIDYHDKELLTFFVDNLKKELKKRKGFRLVIDPNLVYSVRNADGSLIEGNKNDDIAFSNLIDNGFKHFGFNNFLEARQVRWALRMKLDKPYEEKKEEFSGSTKKNLEEYSKLGVVVRKGDEKDLDKMQELFQDTADRKHFYYRKKDYYKNMYKYMHDLMTIYFAHIDPKKYLKGIDDKLREEHSNLDSIRDKMKHDKIGKRLTNQEKVCLDRIEKYKKEQEEAKEMLKEHKDGIDIACLLSMKNGKEYLTLTSGSLEQYRKFIPKYAMYDAHIKDAYENGYKYCNFYGISGVFVKENNPLYGVYEFKRGFNGNVIEYIGEFELSFSFISKLYNGLRKVKRIIKK